MSEPASEKFSPRGQEQPTATGSEFFAWRRKPTETSLVEVPQPAVIENAVSPLHDSTPARNVPVPETKTVLHPVNGARHETEAQTPAAKRPREPQGFSFIGKMKNTSGRDGQNTVIQRVHAKRALANVGAR